MTVTETTETPATRITLAQHLTDGVNDALFATKTENVAPGDEQVLVRVDYIHVVSAFTDLMREDAEIPMPPYSLGDTVGGGSVGTVIKSRSADFAEGDLVMTFTGWRNLVVLDADRAVKVDRNVVPNPGYYLNQGVTAYHGMVDVAKVGKGDVVFVSGAAGGVGSLAGQIARIHDAAKVIGTAGTDEKVRYLVEELGFDTAINYKTDDVAEALRDQAPDGISVFYDNVGGAQFEAAIEAAAPGARFALCGALSSQMSKDPSAWPRFNLMTAITKNLTLRPFATYHTPEQINAWSENFGLWLRNGRLTFPQTVVEGNVEDAPLVLSDLLAGKYKGNVVIKLRS